MKKRLIELITRPRLTKLAAFALLALAVLLFVTCPMSMGPDWIKSIDSGEGPAKVTDLDLTVKVPAPVFGGQATLAVSGEQYRGTITWAPSVNGSFPADQDYMVKVTLTANAGWTFDGVAAGAFSHNGASTITNRANSGEVIIGFPKTGNTVAKVTDLDLTGKVPAPLFGWQARSSVSGEQYGGTITWAPPVNGSFQADKEYMVKVTLTANAGWTFDGVAGAFSHSGADSITNLANPGEVIIVFPKTGNTLLQPVKVTDLDLTVKVPAPAVGGQATVSVSGEQYGGSITWDPPVTGSFQANTVYTAKVTLTANPPWTFDGVGAGSFRHNGASSITNPAGSGTDLPEVTIVFSRTSLLPPSKVTEGDLTDKVPVPVLGEQAKLVVSGDQYWGSITWDPPVTGSFQADTAYTAKVTLTANSPWTFAGVGAGFFTHSGANSINNPAGSGTDLPIGVTIEFPRTGVPPPSKVTERDLTGKVPAPVLGEQAKLAVSGNQYEGSITWDPKVNGVFQVDEVYTATVKLTANAGWTFAGLEANFFSHKEAIDITEVQTSNLVTLTLKFPPVSGDSDGDGFSNDMEEANGFKSDDKDDNPATAGPGSLTITKGETKKLKEDSIIIGFTLGGFTGDANLYYAVAAQDAEAPELSAYPEDSCVAVTSGVQTLDVTDAVAELGKTWRDGYDVYLALMQKGKVARGSVRLPKVRDVTVN
jgi:hypothetical protein